MRLGFHTVHFSPMFGGSAPILDVIAETGRAGFDAIGLDLASVDAGGPVSDVAAAISDAGLSCSDVLVLVPGSDDDLLATAHRLGDLAEAVGAPSCIAAVATPVPQDQLVRSLGACADVLAEHCCRLAVEFTPYSALRTLGAARALCAAIGEERTGLVLDALHFFRSGAPWDELARVRAEDIAVVQWDDAPAAAPESLVDESRNGRLLPGDGALPLARLADAIRGLGYDGVVTAEILAETFRRRDPASAIAATYASLQASLSAGRSAG
jgi:sugar phosphate isomerase/epimerase